MSNQHKVFVVHSKQNAWHVALYGDIHAMARQHEVRITEYGDWMEMTGNGVSTAREEERIRDSVRGIYNIDGVGRRSIEQGIVPEHFLPGGYLNPHQQRLNTSDLDHILSLASVVVLVEDENDHQMTEIMEAEVQRISELAVKKINVRLVRSLDKLRSESIFPFSSNEVKKASGESRRVEGINNRVTVWVRKQDTERMRFHPLDLKLFNLVFALSLEDNWNGGEWNTIEEQGKYAEFSPIRPNCDIHNRILAPLRLAFIAESFAELLRTGNYYMRRSAMLAILCTNSARIVSAAARRAASDIVKVTKYSDMLDEFGLFMWHTRGLKWGAIIREIKRNTGYGITFADGSHIDGAEFSC